MFGAVQALFSRFRFPDPRDGAIVVLYVDGEPGRLLEEPTHERGLHRGMLRLDGELPRPADIDVTHARAVGGAW